MGKHELREEIFRVIFSMDAQILADAGTTPLKIAEDYLNDSCDEELSKTELEYIRDKSARIGSMLGALDQEIDEIAEGWKTNRMGRAELNILRLAVYEIRYDDEVPDKVAVNEAVELAKEYCSEDAPAFINGILKHFVRK